MGIIRDKLACVNDLELVMENFMEKNLEDQMSRKNNPAYGDYNSARTIALTWQ